MQLNEVGEMIPVIPHCAGWLEFPQLYGFNLKETPESRMRDSFFSEKSQENLYGWNINVY